MTDHLSYSSISRYLKCGKQWQKKYIEGLPEKNSDAKDFGSAWHEMIRQYQTMTEPDIDTAWLMALEKYDANMQLGHKMLSSEKITTTIHGLNIKPETLELETELHVPGVPVPVIGFTDGIKTSGIPVDFKTANKRWTQERADNDLQATFGLAALNQMGMIELPCKFEYIVFTKTKHPDVQILETERTQADILTLYGLINEVWQAISREVFTPTDPSNWWCSHKYCSFWDVCEYGGK